MMDAVLLNQLSTLIINGDAVAYKQLYALYHPRLIQFAVSITRSKETAEEVVSDVFIGIWTRRNALAGVKNLHLYLYVSTKNTAINYLLKQKKEQTFTLDEVVVEMKSLNCDPEQLMITAEMLRRLRQAVLQLPPKCQLIFKLVKEDGLKYREVADLLNLSIKTVENQMAIALRKIHMAIQFDQSRAVSSS